MGNQIITIVFPSILVLEVQILGLVVFKKVTALQTFRYHANFLGLGSRDVTNVKLEIRSWALVLAVVTDEVWRAHDVILDALHESWWRPLPQLQLLLAHRHNLSLLRILLLECGGAHASINANILVHPMLGWRHSYLLLTRRHRNMFLR